MPNYLGYKYLGFVEQKRETPVFLVSVVLTIDLKGLLSYGGLSFAPSPTFCTSRVAVHPLEGFWFIKNPAWHYLILKRRTLLMSFIVVRDEQLVVKKN